VLDCCCNAGLLLQCVNISQVSIVHLLMVLGGGECLCHMWCAGAVSCHPVTTSSAAAAAAVSQHSASSLSHLASPHKDIINCPWLVETQMFQLVHDNINH